MFDYSEKPNTNKITEEAESQYLTYATCGMQGWRSRMEDSHIAEVGVGNKKVSLFGVFDGHGGREIAEFVKRNFSKELKSNEMFQKQNYSLALEETFLKMDILLEDKEVKKEIKKFGFFEKDFNTEIENVFLNEKNESTSTSKRKSKNNLEQLSYFSISQKIDISLYCGCTASVCLIDGSNAYFANAGDSRIIISKNGLAIPMTVDHKPENEIEKKRILKANGFIKDGRVNGMLNLSRSIGDLDMKKNDNFDKKNQLVIPHPDIRKIDMLNVNFIFIACDGVFDCLTNQEIVDFITVRLEKMKLGKILEEMLDNILPKSLYDKSMFGYDNMSAILIRLKSIS